MWQWRNQIYLQLCDLESYLVRTLLSKFLLSLFLKINLLQFLFLVNQKFFVLTFSYHYSKLSISFGFSIQHFFPCAIFTLPIFSLFYLYQLFFLFLSNHQLITAHELFMLRVVSNKPSCLFVFRFYCSLLINILSF